MVKEHLPVWELHLQGASVLDEEVVVVFGFQRLPLGNTKLGAPDGFVFLGRRVTVKLELEL